MGPADNGTGPGDKADSESGSPKKGSQQRWIRAPNDAALRNTPCPICQEKFESTWSEDAQDWIWQDATKVGNRVYHASCYAEVAGTKDGKAPGSGTPTHRTGTPDSVLGKRKAEVRHFFIFLPYILNLTMITRNTKRRNPTSK